MKASHSTEIPAGTALTVRVAQPHEVAAFDAQLADHHYLGAGRPVGDYLRQFVERDGVPVALLVWGPSCYALKDRDLWISWSAAQRVERLKLVVQNRRFLLLAPKGQSPNLASQCLGAALRALPEHWREHFGYRPLLAEELHRSGGLCGHVLQGQQLGTRRLQRRLQPAARGFLRGQ